MAKYLYPVVFDPIPEGGYTVRAIDLPGHVTSGENMLDAVDMARDAMELWLVAAEDEHETIPAPSAPDSIKVEPGQFVSLVDGDTDSYRLRMNNRSIKKTLTIPAWLNAKAEAVGVNFSQVLQDALKSLLA